jgi:tRNA uridine 5-carboxymethylaminomethyl modification enzyme
MFTSRAEYRLLLREDNADRRLSGIGVDLGLLDSAAGARVLAKTANVAAEIARLGTANVAASDRVNTILAECGSAAISHSIRAAELLKRPEVSYSSVTAMAGLEQALSIDEAAELEIEIKYDGYVKRQAEAVERYKRLEDTVIPDWIDFHGVGGLSNEVRERLSSARPQSLGQAARMPGITPAAVSIIAVHIRMGQ